MPQQIRILLGTIVSSDRGCVNEALTDLAKKGRVRLVCTAKVKSPFPLQQQVIRTMSGRRDRWRQAAGSMYAMKYSEATWLKSCMMITNVLELGTGNSVGIPRRRNASTGFV